MTEEHAVLAANATFYRAMAAGDLAAMDALWARARPVACIHPGWRTLIGRAVVMESWRAVLANPPAITHAAAACHLLGDAAFVTCTESIEGTVLAATNLFVREDGAWRLVHHHAGHVLETGPAEAGALH